MAVLASCSKSLLTHDLENPKPAITLKPHNGTINSSIWSHNNQVIATCGSDGKIVLNHATNGKNLLSLDDENSKSMQVNSIWFTSNSQFLASGGNDGLLKVWDLKQRALLYTQKYHFSSITSVHYNVDDSLLASSSLAGDIVLHNTRMNSQAASFNQKGSQGIKMVKFSPLVSNTLASAGMDGSVFVWDITTSQSTATFTHHSSRVNSISFSNFNPVLMCSAGLDQNINFYDIREKKVVKTLTTDAPLTALGFHNDGHTIVVGTLYGGLYVYDLKASGAVKTFLKGHDSNPVNFVDFVRQEEPKFGSSVNSMSSMIEEEVVGGSVKKVVTGKPSVSQDSIGGSKKPTPAQSDFGGPGKVSVLGSDFANLAVGRTSASKTVENSKMLEEPRFGTAQNITEQKQPFLDINNIRKQVSETKPPTVDKGLSSFKFSGSTAQQDFQTADTIKFQPSDLGRKTFENIASGSMTKDKSADAMNIEVPVTKNLTGFAPQVMDKIEEKSNSYISKIEGSKEFTPSQREFIQDCFKDQNNYIKECLYEMQNGISDGVANLHLEVIRQFEIQKNELDAKLDRYFTEFNMMFQRQEELRRENERLKKTSY